MVDYYSRCIEIALLKRTTATEVIAHMKSIFARHGIPKLIVSDNGPQYSSEEFPKFMREYQCQHVTSSPLYPQSNGEAERAVKTIKGLLKKEGDPYLALLSYRATPLQIGYSPSELLMGRKLRTTVPTTREQLIPRVPDSTLICGLNVIALQSTFHVKGYIRNVTAYGNTGSILLRINCKAAIQATQVHSTGGDHYGFRLEFIGETTNCRSQVIFHMSHSYFGRNNVGALINFVFITYFVRVKLENITVENNRQALEVLDMNHGSVLIMENVNINHNTGPLVIISEKSFIEFHG